MRVLHRKDICITHVSNSLNARTYDESVFSPWQIGLNRPPGIRRKGNKDFNVPSVT